MSTSNLHVKKAENYFNFFKDGSLLICRTQKTETYLNNLLEKKFIIKWLLRFSNQTDIIDGVESWTGPFLDYNKISSETPSNDDSAFPKFNQVW